MFPIFGHIGRIIFDTGASHYFVRTGFAWEMGMIDFVSNIILHIDSPVGRGEPIQSVCRGIGIVIGRVTFVADLLVLEMHTYDIILGMYWLA